MPPYALDVAEPGHVAGAFLWGLEQTDKLLFASSEPPDDGLTGCHKAFDISRRKPIYTFDCKEAGDALCIDPSGEHHLSGFINVCPTHSTYRRQSCTIYTRS